MPRVVANLATQTGVRYSLEHSAAYFQSDWLDSGQVLDGCRQSRVVEFLQAFRVAVVPLRRTNANNVFTVSSQDLTLVDRANKMPALKSPSG